MRKINHHIQIYEHETLRVGEVRDGVVFTEHHWKQLIQLNENQYPPYFQLVHEGIRALHYVGIIALDGLILEILPKVNKTSTFHAQNLLTEMLQETGRLPKNSITSSMLPAEGKLIDMFIQSFILEVEKIAQNGLLKRYRKVHRNDTKFTGSLKLKEHIRHNCVHKERIYAEQQVFDSRHILNEIIHEALVKVQEFCSDTNLQARCKKLLSNLPKPAQDFDMRSVSKIRLSREEAYYDKALQWAQFILYKLKPQSGASHLRHQHYLIDMQQLFEEYVALKLQAAATTLGCTINLQRRSNFWKRRSIRPDMVLTTPEGDTFILDTKWKILKKDEPEDADLKQIYIYNQFFKAKRGLLIYPSQANLKGYSAKYNDVDPNASISCELVFINLFDEEHNRMSTTWPVELLKNIFMENKMNC